MCLIFWTCVKDYCFLFQDAENADVTLNANHICNKMDICKANASNSRLKSNSCFSGKGIRESFVGTTESDADSCKTKCFPLGPIKCHSTADNHTEAKVSSPCTLNIFRNYRT